MYPHPPGNPGPPSRPPSGDLDLVGLALLAAAGLSIWLLWFWWGIAIFAVGFVTIAVVTGANEASGDLGRTARQRSGPPSAQLHAAASGFLSGMLGFGVAATVGHGVNGRFGGVIAAATTALVLETGVGRLLDMNWNGALGSWCLLSFVWFLISVPLAAYIAPGYEVTGVTANVGAILLVYGSSWLIWRASPWRHRWDKSIDSPDS
jgi:hypothetical protein